MADRKLELVLITGMSGSGKSVALHALEDAGYYCVDNLPPALLLQFIALQQGEASGRVAIAMDVRSAKGLPLVPGDLDTLRAQGIHQIFVFGRQHRDTGAPLFRNPPQTSFVPNRYPAGRRPARTGRCN